MEIFWSSRSPYVRKVMICAFELGLYDRIKRIPAAATRSVNENVAPHNPIGQIPTLVLDDGSALYDSPVICEYLDSLSPHIKLIPREGNARFSALRRQAIGDGIMDFLVPWSAAKNAPAPQQNPAFLAASRQRFFQILDGLSATAADWTSLPIDIGHIAIGSALAYADFRFAEEPWRGSRDRLAEWYANFARRPSFVATDFAAA